HLRPAPDEDARRLGQVVQRDRLTLDHQEVELTLGDVALSTERACYSHRPLLFRRHIVLSGATQRAGGPGDRSDEGPSMSVGVAGGKRRTGVRSQAEIVKLANAFAAVVRTVTTVRLVHCVQRGTDNLIGTFDGRGA